jgi:hypothetical protein
MVRDGGQNGGHFDGVAARPSRGIRGHLSAIKYLITDKSQFSRVTLRSLTALHCQPLTAATPEAMQLALEDVLRVPKAFVTSKRATPAEVVTPSWAWLGSAAAGVSVLSILGRPAALGWD